MKQGYNDLATIDPALASQWHPTKNGALMSAEVTIGSGKSVWWLCEKCGYEWQSRIYSRVMKGTCPVEAGKVVKQGWNDLETMNLSLASQWHPTRNRKLTPRDVTMNSHKYVWWLCEKCGYHWEAKICNRSSGNGCPVEAGQAILKGYNDLATLSPLLAQEWHPMRNGKLTPQEVTLSSRKRVWWLCEKCGHEWPATIGNRSNGRKCPPCAHSGFDPSLPAYLYILNTTLQGNQIIQFGITNHLDARLRKHKKSGFVAKPIVLINYNFGIKARMVETSLLQLMKEHGVPSCFRQNIYFDGATEAFLVEDTDGEFVEDFMSILS